jgi:hypothetical protein
MDQGQGCLKNGRQNKKNLVKKNKVVRNVVHIDNRQRADQHEYGGRDPSAEPTAAARDQSRDVS